MEEKKYELVKFNDEGIFIDVRVSPEENTVWLKQREMANLFNVSIDSISLHINNIIREGELDSSTIEESSAVQFEGKRKVKRLIKYYNLDMVISVGYRVKSKRGVIFRKWASSVLKEYLLKGYVINENRVTVSNENYIELRNEVSSINNRLIKVEEKIFNDDIRIDQIFYNGSFYDSYTLIQSIFEQANDTIIIIDNKKIYHLGASIKDLGKKIFSIIESDSTIIEELLNRIK